MVTVKLMVLPAVCIVGFGVSFLDSRSIAAILLVPLLWALAGTWSYKRTQFDLGLRILARVQPQQPLTSINGDGSYAVPVSRPRAAFVTDDYKLRAPLLTLDEMEGEDDTLQRSRQGETSL